MNSFWMHLAVGVAAVYVAGGISAFVAVMRHTEVRMPKKVSRVSVALLVAVFWGPLVLASYAWYRWYRAHHEPKENEDDGEEERGHAEDRQHRRGSGGGSVCGDPVRGHAEVDRAG